MSGATLPVGPRPLDLALSFFPNVYAQAPLARTVDWARLAARLAAFSVRGNVTDKRDLPCWSPAVFSPGEASTTERALSVGCLVLDIDGGASIEEAVERCDPLTFALHTSWRHRSGAPRFRVVLPLARPISAERWPAAWLAGVERLGLAVDRSCVNANRRYFLPACPRADSDHNCIVHTTEVALDLRPLLSESGGTAVLRSGRRLVVPHYQIERAIRERLASDPTARERAAERLGARVHGQGAKARADHIPCPACGRPSAWFFLNPDRATRARCCHRKSCGWSGPLTELLGGAS